MAFELKKRVKALKQTEHVDVIFCGVELHQSG
jgi:hypothetical protein